MTYYEREMQWINWCRELSDERRELESKLDEIAADKIYLERKIRFLERKLREKNA